MATTLAVNDILEFRDYQSINDVRLINVYHYRISTVAVAITNDQLFMAAANVALTNDTASVGKVIRTAQSQDVVHNSMQSQRVYPVRTRAVSTVVNKLGTIELPGMPANSTISMELTADEPGPHGVGRKSFSGTPQSYISFNQLIDPGLAIWTTVGLALTGPVTVTSAAGTGTMVPVILNRAAANLSFRFTNAVPKITTRVQHSRTVGVGF